MNFFNFWSGPSEEEEEVDPEQLEQPEQLFAEERKEEITELRPNKKIVLSIIKEDCLLCLGVVRFFNLANLSGLDTETKMRWYNSNKNSVYDALYEMNKSSVYFASFIEQSPRRIRLYYKRNGHYDNFWRTWWGNNKNILSST